MPPYTSLALPIATPLSGTPASVTYVPTAQVSSSPRPQALWPDLYTFGKRQASSDKDYPDCAHCLETGDPGNCDGHACLCQSPVFMESVQSCFSATCNSATEWNAAYFYVQRYCAAVGVNIPSSTIAALPGATATAAAHPDGYVGPEGELAGEQTSGVAPGAVPTVYTTRSKSTLTVDVVMGCVCSSLLALAFILGGINIFKIYKLEQQQSQLGSRAYTTQGGTQMSHIKSYNNFDYDPTKSNQARSAFAAGPSRGKSMNRGHDLTHLDASAFNAFPRRADDDQIHVHTATTVETTPVSAEFPPFGTGSSEDGLTTTTTVHLGDAVEVPVLGRERVQFVLDEDGDSDKDEKKGERKKKSVNRL